MNCRSQLDPNVHAHNIVSSNKTKVKKKKKKTKNNNKQKNKRTKQLTDNNLMRRGQRAAAGGRESDGSRHHCVRNTIRRCLAIVCSISESWAVNFSTLPNAT